MSSSKAVLIIGGSGFVGTHLALRLRERYKVFATYHQHPVHIPGVTFIPANVNNRTWIKRVVYTVRPDVVVYAAGSNGFEGGENVAKDLESTHVTGAATLANTAEIFAPKFIYLSNCYVFDGSRGNYHETDTVLPVAALGKVKLGGENFVRGKCLNYTIVRSSPLLGRSSGVNFSFLDRIRMLLDRGEHFEVPDEEIHSFAPVHHFAETIETIIESGVKNRSLHYGGLTKLSHYELACRFAKRFGYDANLIRAKRSNFRERSSKGNANPTFDYSINSTQTMGLLKIQPLLLEQSFDLIEKKLISGF